MRRLWMIVTLLVGAAGCAPLSSGPPPPPFPETVAPQIQPGMPAAVSTVQYVSPIGPSQPDAPLANPIRVPVGDRDVAWEEIISVVQDYFKVQHEERVRLVGDILTEGRIDTFPLIGQTLLEPWRGDSVTFRDKLEATLQTIRRRANLRVIPADQNSFLIELTVVKELEDLRRPQTSYGTATFETENLALDRISEPLPGIPDRPAFATASQAATPAPGKLDPPGPLPTSWIPQGRDVHLEQEMLAKIQARLIPYGAPAFVAPGGNVGLPPSY